MNDTEKPRFVDAFQVQCERAAFYASAWLRIARRCPAPAAILEVLRSVPLDPHEGRFIDECFFMRVGKSAIDSGSFDSDLWREVVKYFTEEFVAMTPKRRELVLASIAGTLMGFDMGG